MSALAQIRVAPKDVGLLLLSCRCVFMSVECGSERQWTTALLVLRMWLLHTDEEVGEGELQMMDTQAAGVKQGRDEEGTVAEAATVTSLGEEEGG